MQMICAEIRSHDSMQYMRVNTQEPHLACFWHWIWIAEAYLGKPSAANNPQPDSYPIDSWVTRRNVSISVQSHTAKMSALWKRENMRTVRKAEMRIPYSTNVGQEKIAGAVSWLWSVLTCAELQ